MNIQSGAYVNLDGTAGDISLSSGISMTTAGLSFLNTVGNNTINGNITVIAGTTTVSEGTLLINGNDSLATGVVTVESGGTLGGANTIQLNGALAAGDRERARFCGTRRWSGRLKPRCRRWISAGNRPCHSAPTAMCHSGRHGMTITGRPCGYGLGQLRQITHEDQTRPAIAEENPFSATDGVACTDAAVARAVKP
jgi:hypothetical protein